MKFWDEGGLNVWILSWNHRTLLKIFHQSLYQLDFKIWKISILGARPPQFLVAFPVKVERCVIALNASKIGVLHHIRSWSTFSNFLIQIFGAIWQSPQILKIWDDGGLNKWISSWNHRTLLKIFQQFNWILKFKKFLFLAPAPSIFSGVSRKGRKVQNGMLQY